MTQEYINMTEEEFNNNFPTIKLDDNENFIIQFSPVFIKPKCPNCNSGMKKGKAGVYSHYEKGSTIYSCKKYGCSTTITPSRIKRIRVYYKVKKGFKYDNIKYKSISISKLDKRKVRNGKVGEMSKIKVILRSFKNLYKRGIDSRKKLEKTEAVCKLSKEEARKLVKVNSQDSYASLEEISEKYLNKIDKIMEKYDYKPFSSKMEKWEYELRDFENIFLQQIYKHKKNNQKMVLQIPQQSDNKKTDSWFILKGVTKVDKIELLDSKGNSYKYPIVDTNNFEIRVYSWRYYKKIFMMKCKKCGRIVGTASNKSKIVKEMKKISECAKCGQKINKNSVKFYTKEDSNGISKRVPIEIAINKLEERLDEKLNKTIDIHTDSEEIKEMFTTISNQYSDKVGLVGIKNNTAKFVNNNIDKINHKIIAYIVIGELNKYLVFFSKRGGNIIINIDTAVDKNGSLVRGKSVSKIKVNNNYSLLYNKISSIIYLLVNDIYYKDNLNNKLKQYKMSPMTVK